MNLEQIQIGAFEVTSNVLVVSDPSYEPGTWCMGQILDAQLDSPNRNMPY